MDGTAKRRQAIQNKNSWLSFSFVFLHLSTTEADSGLFPDARRALSFFLRASVAIALAYRSFFA